MKQLLGKNIWIILLSIVVIVFVLIYDFQHSRIFPPNDMIPFISCVEQDTNINYTLHQWSLRNGTIAFSENPLFSASENCIDSLIWNGNQEILVPPSVEPCITVPNGSSLHPLYVLPKTSLSIQRILRPNLSIQLSIQDYGKHTQATAEYYGYKQDKITLSPDLEKYTNAVLIRPIDAIEVEATTYLYLQFAWLDHETNLKFGIIEGQWSDQSLLWRIVTDDIEFQETGKGSNVVVCQGRIWFALLDGSIRSVVLHNGSIENQETFEAKIDPGTEKSIQAELFRYQNAVIMKKMYAQSSCKILVVENNTPTSRIEATKDFVTIFQNEKETMIYQNEDGYKNPSNWLFPIF
jgi:hypothetical protein